MSPILAPVDFLVSYGPCGDFGLFRAEEPLPLARSDQVVIHSERGIEIGSVLRGASARHLRQMPAGRLLRRPNHADHTCNMQRQREAQRVRDRAEQLVQELGVPLAILDAECLLDGRAYLHVLRQSSTEPRDLIRALSREFDRVVALLDLVEPAEASHDCGSCSGDSCGSCGDGGGCGSCGTERFAELREKMEKRAETDRRIPLL